MAMFAFIVLSFVVTAAQGNVIPPKQRIAHGQTCTGAGQGNCVAGLVCGVISKKCECYDSVHNYFDGTCKPMNNVTWSHAVRWYHFSESGQYTFSQAKKYCSDRKLHLPLPTTLTDSTFLTQTLVKSGVQEFWLDMHHVGSQIWVKDSAPAQRVKWFNWNEDKGDPEPNGDVSGECVFAISTSGSWFDSVCNTYMTVVVCERDGETSSQVASVPQITTATTIGPTTTTTTLTATTNTTPTTTTTNTTPTTSTTTPTTTTTTPKTTTTTPKTTTTTPKTTTTTPTTTHTLPTTTTTTPTTTTTTTAQPTTTTTPKPVACPPDWHLSLTKCHTTYPAPDRCTYSKAVMTCVGHLNSTLPVPVSQSEHDSLVKYATDNFLIGISDKKRGYGPRQSTMPAWSVFDDKDTDHATDRCITVDHVTGHWRHVDCRDVGVKVVICEIDAKQIHVVW